VGSIEGVFMDKKEFEEFRKRVGEEMKRIKRERPIMSDKFTYKEEGEIIIYPPRQEKERD
jgi:hypothetical protein